MRDNETRVIPVELRHHVLNQQSGAISRPRLDVQSAYT
jgi:hypothetical protein